MPIESATSCPADQRPSHADLSEGRRYNLHTVDIVLPPGSLFVGRYQVDHLIGRGPRKQTYLAWDPKARRQVALAVMVPGADPLATQREVDMLGKVCPHPNIVTLHEADLDADPPYLVFEYIPGGELRDFYRNLQSQGQHVPLRDFFRTARQLCRALAQVHGRRLIHRDVSATHIWLDERHEAHLGDFDRAMSVDEPLLDHGGPPATEGYPAPELLSDAPDARADLYSLGAVLYELLTARVPTLTGQCAQLAPPSRWRRDAPPGLDKLILSMLAADREDRPLSAQAVLDELRSIEKTADLDSLISNGESTRMEFKQTMQWDTKLHKRNQELLRACVKTVCAFLNGEGGILLIGVANSGELTGLEDDIRDFSDRKTIDGFESRFRDALVAGLDPESSHLVTISFPHVHGVQICRVDVEHSPHPVFLVSKNIPQQFYIRQEGAPPQPVRCPSCGELIHPPEFYVRKGNASRPLDIRQAHEYIGDHWA
jgi:serine/threonine protein kinase